jgi:hypothetical protein
MQTIRFVHLVLIENGMRMSRDFYARYKESNHDYFNHCDDVSALCPYAHGFRLATG